MTSEEDWKAAVATASDRFGKLDILVNNAGLFLRKDIKLAGLAERGRLCAGNLTGVFSAPSGGCRRCGRRRQSAHGSAIVNLASTAGLVGSTGTRSIR